MRTETARLPGRGVELLNLSVADQFIGGFWQGLLLGTTVCSGFSGSVAPLYISSPPLTAYDNLSERAAEALFSFNFLDDSGYAAN